MPFNIDQFRGAVLNKGLLKPSKFEIEIPIPTALTNAVTNPNTNQPTVGTVTQGVADGINSAKSTLRFMCEAVTLPGVQVASSEVRRFGYGPFERKPYAPTFTDINVTILADAKGQNWDLFQKWIQLITNFDLANRARNGIGNLEFFEINYKQNYAVDITISCYPDYDSVTPAIRLKLYEAFPVFLGDISLNWGNTNDIMRIPVTFTFFTWSNDINGNKTSVTIQNSPDPTQQQNNTI